MEKHALLLSSWYLPIRTVRWQLAVKLVYEERVDTLASYDELISSPSVTWNIPAVIRYRRGNNSRKQKIRFSRTNVFLRDGYVCQYCQKSFLSSQLTLDHVIPRSHGGQRCWENIVSACRQCNAKKSNLSCDEAGMFPIKHPAIPNSLPVGARHFGSPQVPNQWLPFLEGWT